MWADFDVSGTLLNSDSSVNDSFNQNDTISGYELILPIIAVILISIGNTLFGFVSTKVSKTIATTLIGFSALFVIYLYLHLGSPATAKPNSLFRPPVPMIGTGYYVLLISAVVSFVYALITFKR